jgi:uncharacterized protein YecE (DUF72 family)
VTSAPVGGQQLTIWIGTSGWQYRDWRGTFYPARLAQAHWLESYAGAFATVESNNAFYRLPERRVFEAWADRTPDDFRMAVKLSRFLTHVRRLRDPAEPVERFLDRASGLGAKLGPVLIQLPPQLRSEPSRLADTLDQFPAGVRVAVEFRHGSWFSDDVRSLLEQRGAALCLADRRGLRTPLWRTADWTYVRFHEGRAAPQPCYGRTTLATWIERIRDGWGRDAEAWVYFNNDPRGCAPRDAARFGAMAARAGLHPSRTPPARTIRPRRG